MDYMDLFDDHPIGIIRLDKKDLPQKSNRSARDFLGYSEDELYSSEFRSRIHPEDAERDKQLFYETLSGDREFYDMPCRFIRKDGTTVWGFTRVFVHWFTGGGLDKITRLIQPSNIKQETSKPFKIKGNSAVDLIELNNLQKKLQIAKSMEDRWLLAMGTLHDVNCVFTTTLGYLALMQLEIPAESPMLERIDVLLKVNEVGQDRANKALKSCRRKKPELNSTDLNVLVEGIEQKLQFNALKDIKIDLKLSSTYLPVMIEENQLHSILSNLVINACQAIEHENVIIQISTGTIECSRKSLSAFQGGNTMTPGQYVFIKVVDNGTGLDQEKQKKVFEPFFSTRPGQDGLGLTVARGIALKNGGAIAFYSKPGKGSSVTVLLPEAKTDRTNLNIGFVESIRLGDKSVLIFTEKTLNDLISSMLKRLGISSLTSLDGNECVKTYKENSEAIALVILDISIAELNMEKTFRTLKEFSPELKVILLNDQEQKEEEKFYTESEISGLLKKPFNLKDLADTIESAK